MTNRDMIKTKLHEYIDSMSDTEMAAMITQEMTIKTSDKEYHVFTDNLYNERTYTFCRT